MPGVKVYASLLDPAESSSYESLSSLSSFSSDVSSSFSTGDSTGVFRGVTEPPPRRACELMKPLLPRSSWAGRVAFVVGASVTDAFLVVRSLVGVVDVCNCCFLSAAVVSVVGDKVPCFLVTVGVFDIVYNVGVVAVGTGASFFFGFVYLAVAYARSSLSSLGRTQVFGKKSNSRGYSF